MADNFCNVKIRRFLSWLKGVANENLSGMALVLFVNLEIGTSLQGSCWLLALAYYYAISLSIEEAFFKSGTKRELMILVLASISKLMLKKECNSWTQRTFIRSISSSWISFCIKQEDWRFSRAAVTQI